MQAPAKQRVMQPYANVHSCSVIFAATSVENKDESCKFWLTGSNFNATNASVLVVS